MTTLRQESREEYAALERKFQELKEQFEESQKEKQNELFASLNTQLDQLTMSKGLCNYLSSITSLASGRQDQGQERTEGQVHQNVLLHPQRHHSLQMTCILYHY